jgi:hypothetical protein
MITSFTGTDLVYNILEAQLVGEIDGEAISSYAVSGGRAGSKLSDVVPRCWPTTRTQRA